MYKKLMSLLLSAAFLNLSFAGIAEEQKTFSFVDQAETAATEATTPEKSIKKPDLTKITLNAGTRVPVTIYNTVNSNNLKSGDMIGITVNKDIYVDGHQVFKKGSDGVLFVSESKKSGGHGKAGRLEISGGRITDIYGNDHPINLSISSKGESKRGGAIVSSVLGVALILVPFGLWIDGKPATLQGGSQYDALTTSPTEIVIASK